MSGPSADLYAKVGTFLSEQNSNLGYINDPAIAQLKEILDDPACYVNKGIQEAGELLKSLQKEVKAKVKKEHSIAEKQIQGLEIRVQSIAEYSQLTKKQKNEVQASFEQVIAEIKEQPVILTLNKPK